MTYLFETCVTLVDSDDLSGGLDFVYSLGVVDELGLHAGVVFHVGRVIKALGDIVGVRSETCLAISEPENIL